jgi:ribonuclease D
MRERTYRARLCLVQVAAGDGIELVDPLGGGDLSGIAELIGDESVQVIVHAGKQDLEIFHEAFGVVPRNVFDVQLAAGFAGYGASLPYGRLVELLTGTLLVKGESYTDWCRRPLTEKQMSYAADDVRYLSAMCERLERELEALGRTGWVRDEMAPLEQAESYGVAPHEAWRKVAGRGALTPRQTAVLREVAAWRERTAARRDVPRGWLVKDPTLIEIARRQPSSTGALKSIRGLNAKEAERSGGEIMAAIERGRRADPIGLDGRAAPRDVAARARVSVGLADAVLRARAERARVAPELVATRAELEAVLVDAFSDSGDPGRHRVLRGWRRELAGECLLALARGEVAVRVVDDPPYVEEVTAAWPATRNA